MAFFLCLDAGNTRLKFAAARRDGTVDGLPAPGALPWNDLAQLPVALQTLADTLSGTPGLPFAKVFSRALLSSVVSPENERQLISLVGAPVRRLVSVRQAAGVENGYADPAQLGVDRWCALIGARARVARACLVVSLGTATTIDSLDAVGRFLGGFILPGVELMRHALYRGTARLARSAGQYSAFPGHSGDAIFSGCLEAQLGAIERAFARLPEEKTCLLSGGDAERLLPHLAIPATFTPNLTLEGIRRWALAAPDLLAP